MKEVISTDKAPQAIGPYSQAIKSGGLVFCSGQIPLKPNGSLVEGPIEEQVRQVMLNLQAVLKAAGASFENVVKSTIFLTDLADFERVNQVYDEYFSNEPPARATVQAAALPKGVAVEIEMVATV